MCVMTGSSPILTLLITLTNRCLWRVLHDTSHFPYILPIRFTPYGVPFDINMHDSVLEKERTIEKDHIFVSSEAPSEELSRFHHI